MYNLPSSAVPWLLCDLDDTLLGVRFPDGSIRPSAAAYDDCIRRFREFIDGQGLDGAAAVLLQHDIDLVMAKEHGFGVKTRFAESMVLAAKELLSPRPLSVVVASGVYQIGMSVFTDYPYTPLEGALDVLDYVSRFYDIAIITKGENGEQWRKIQETGISDYVEPKNVFVVDKKDYADWTRVLAALRIDNVEESWAIGNSAKADVNPLVGLGYNGIEIAGKNNWVFEHSALAAPLHGRITKTVTDITHVLDVLPLPPR